MVVMKLVMLMVVTLVVVVVMVLMVVMLLEGSDADAAYGLSDASSEL